MQHTRVLGPELGSGGLCGEPTTARRPRCTRAWVKTVWMRAGSWMGSQGPGVQAGSERGKRGLLCGFTCASSRTTLGLRALPVTSRVTLGKPPPLWVLVFSTGKKNIGASELTVCLVCQQCGWGPHPLPLEVQGGSGGDCVRSQDQNADHSQTGLPACSGLSSRSLELRGGPAALMAMETSPAVWPPGDPQHLTLQTVGATVSMGWLGQVPPQT